jgi:hypothetical protein
MSANDSELPLAKVGHRQAPTPKTPRSKPLRGVFTSTQRKITPNKNSRQKFDINFCFKPVNDLKYICLDLIS